MNDVVRGLMGNDFFLASLCYLLVVVPTLGIAMSTDQGKRLSCLMRTNIFTRITMKGLDRNRLFPYTKRVNSRIMTITTKFKKDIQTLLCAF